MSETTSETLLGLVKRYSPSGQERPIVQWLVERMRAVGFTRSFVDPVGNAARAEPRIRRPLCDSPMRSH